MTGQKRRGCSFHSRGIAEGGIAVSGGEGGGHGTAGSRTGVELFQIETVVDITAVIVGLELAGDIGFGAGNVAVDIDTARHDHHALGVDAFCLRWHAFNDLAVLDANIARFAIYIIGRVVHPSVDDTERRSHLRSLSDDLADGFPGWV